MDYNEFEDHVKKTLHNQEEAVDVSKIMLAVEASQKSGRKGLIILFATILLFSSFTIGYFVYDNDSEDLASPSDSQKVVSEAIVPSSSVDENQLLVSNELPVSEGNNTKIANVLTVKSSLDKTKNLEKKNLTLVGTQNLNTQQNSIYKQDNELFKQLPSDSYVETSSSNSSESLNNVTFARQEAQTILQETPLFENISLQNLAIEKLNNTGKILFSGTPQKVECPSFNKNPWIFEIGTVMGVSDPVKRFSINPTEINPALTSRAENEKSLEGLDLEFNLSAKRTRWPVFIKSGVAYSRWTERMNLEQNYTEIDTVQGIVSATVSQTGDTITYIYGDIFIEKDFEIKKKVHYYINRVSIPLSVVYEKEFGDNAIQGELGASFNIRTFSAGSVYESENTFTPVNIGNFFSTLTGVSYFTKVHYRRYVTDHMFIGALAHFHYLPAEFSNQSSFSQKYLNYGLGLYAGYRF